jgi:hypothetical protein
VECGRAPPPSLPRESSFCLPAATSACAVGELISSVRSFWSATFCRARPSSVCLECAAASRCRCVAPRRQGACGRIVRWKGEDLIANELWAIDQAPFRRTCGDLRVSPNDRSKWRRRGGGASLSTTCVQSSLRGTQSLRERRSKACWQSVAGAQL